MNQVTQDKLDKLSATVQQFLSRGEAFTGYDITIETRNEHRLGLRHRDVSTAIHELSVLNDAMDFGYQNNGVVQNWTRSQKTMNGGQWAWVYHPQGYDINNYQPRNSSSQSIYSQPAAIQTTATPVPAVSMTALPAPTDGHLASDSGGKQSDGSYTTDSRNRLLVPTRFLREAGLDPSEKVSVVLDSVGKTILIVRDATPFQNKTVQIETQTVERNGDIRLYRRTLELASLDAESKFQIETKDVDPDLKAVAISLFN